MEDNLLNFYCINLTITSFLIDELSIEKLGTGGGRER